MTDTTQNIYPITGKIFSSPYDWGGTKLVPQTLGFTPEPGVPYAEYWLAGHKNAPSEVEQADGKKRLDEMIALQPDQILGSNVATRYGGHLPFLFKLLEAQKMLSIQVHPDKELAEKGFVEEERSGLPSSDIRRTYKDSNSKTEMAVALDDFWLLHGLLPEKELLEILNKTHEFNSLIPFFEKGDYKKLYRHVLIEMSGGETNEMLDNLAKRILPQYESGKLQKTSPDYWAAKAIKDFAMHADNYDRGIFSIYFLNIVHLKQGQAIFQQAGVIHAYLEGPIIEVMQNSDNIARAGITVKQIDIDGLMKLMTFAAHTPHVIEGREVKNEVFYDSPVDEFLVSKILPTAGNSYKNTSHSAEILMGLVGNATISAQGKTLPLNKGKSVFIIAGTDYEISGSENDVVYKTSVPVKNE